jgi:hypothetical protein
LTFIVLSVRIKSVDGFSSILRGETVLKNQEECQRGGMEDEETNLPVVADFAELFDHG